VEIAFIFTKPFINLSDLTSPLLGANFYYFMCSNTAYDKYLNYLETSLNELLDNVLPDGKIVMFAASIAKSETSRLVNKLVTNNRVIKASKELFSNNAYSVTLARIG
jgi:hypothetical protein